MEVVVHVVGGSVPTQGASRVCDDVRRSLDRLERTTDFTSLPRRRLDFVRVLSSVADDSAARSQLAHFLLLLFFSSSLLEWKCVVVTSRENFHGQLSRSSSLRRKESDFKKWTTSGWKGKYDVEEEEKILLKDQNASDILKLYTLKSE